MKLNTIVVGAVASAAAAVPVLAQHHSFNHNLNGNGAHASGVGFLCDFADNDAFRNGTGYFSRFVTNGHTHFQWVGGASDADGNVTGLRIDAVGIPARTYTMDISQTGNTDDSFFTNIFNGKENSTGFKADSIFLDEICTSTSPWSSQTLRNGFTRYFYNAQNDSTVKSGDKFSAIYFCDQNGFDDGFGQTFQDTITNATVNGVAVVPNLHGTTAFDCNGALFGGFHRS
jgi:hypothetical protein